MILICDDDDSVAGSHTACVLGLNNTGEGGAQRPENLCVFSASLLKMAVCPPSQSSLDTISEMKDLC